MKIIPFKGQNERPTSAVKGRSTQAKENSSIAHLYNKEPKKLHKPTNAYNQSLIGINDLLSKTEDKEDDKNPISIENTAIEENPFSIDELRMNWLKYAHIAKKDNINTLYNAMKASDPSLKNNYEVVFTVKNNVQKQFIETHNVQIVGFLKKELRNHKIHLTLKEESSEEDQLFTSKGKFDDMVKRNPKLENLRNRFDLDLDL